MSSLKFICGLILTILFFIEIAQYLLQNQGEFSPSGIPIDIRTKALIGTDEYLYAAAYCFDWEGNLIWENPELSKNTIEFSGDALFMETYNQKIDGVALLTLEGEILWQREVGKIAHVGIGASPQLFAVGTREGVLWAFSETGGVLWKYYNTAAIDQVAVAPDSSRVVFTDYGGYVTCVGDDRVIWSRKVGDMEVPLRNRTIAFSPDSSFVVYGSKVGEPALVACTVDGIELWSAPLKKSLHSVAVTRDGHVVSAGVERRYSIVAYVFRSQGTRT